MITFVVCLLVAADLYPVCFLDGTKAKTTLTDQQLMTLAKKMGKDWKEIAIECLKLEMKDIQQIQAKEEEVNVHKFLMLEKWRKGEKSNGTAQNLYDSLKDHVSYEIIQILEGTLQLFFILHYVIVFQTCFWFQYQRIH